MFDSNLVCADAVQTGLVKPEILRKSESNTVRGFKADHDDIGPDVLALVENIRAKRRAETRGLKETAPLVSLAATAVVA